MSRSKAEGSGHVSAHTCLIQFHNDEGTQDIAKQPRIHRKRPDENFQYVDRCDDGDWFSKTFQPFLQAFSWKPEYSIKVLISDDSATVTFEILCGRFWAERPRWDWRRPRRGVTVIEWGHIVCRVSSIPSKNLIKSPIPISSTNCLRPVGLLQVTDETNGQDGEDCHE